MRYHVTIKGVGGALSESLVYHYLEEAEVFKGQLARSGNDLTGVFHEYTLARMRDILTKAQLPVDIKAELIKNDPHEARIQKKLYPAGNTSKKPFEARDRLPPSESRKVRRTSRTPGEGDYSQSPPLGGSSHIPGGSEKGIPRENAAGQTVERIKMVAEVNPSKDKD